MTAARRAPLPALVLAGLAALAPAAAAQDGEAGGRQDRSQGSGPPLVFAWPVPSRVRVTDTQTKDERTSVTRYVVELTPAPAGDGVAMRCVDFEILAYTGLDLADPVAKQKAASVAAMSEAVPTLIIDPAGRARGVLEDDHAIDAVLAHAKELGVSGEELTRVERMLRAPPVVATMRQKAFDSWMLWVGAWVGLHLAPGESLHTELEVPMPDGAIAKAPTIVRHLGLKPAKAAGLPPQLAHLNADSVLEGDDVRRALGRVVADLLTQSPPPQGLPPDPDMIESFRRTSRLSVLTDPATLRPQEASLETTQAIALKGLGSRTTLERHEYTFEWVTGDAPSEGTGPSAPGEGGEPPR